VLLGDLRTAQVQGALVFVIGDLIKIVIAALVLPGGWALAKLRRRH
jgi:biotin transporter BioY